MDLFALGQSLPARYQQNAAWLSNYTWEYSIRNFANAASPLSSSFWTDLGGGAPPMLLGKPYHRTSGMMAAPLSTATASSDYPMVIGDWSNYLVVDRLGSTIHFSDWVIGSSRRPTGEAGWMFFTRFGGAVLNNDAFRLQLV